MGLKRSHEDSHGHETMHPSRQATLQPQSKSHPRKKPRRFEPPTFNSKSVNPLKKKIRDISRLLDRSDNLPADVRLSNERALKAYQQDLLAAEQERRRQKMIKKYHMVRFFERQKATRLLKKLRKRMSADLATVEQDDLKRQIHETEVDLNYALYCPLDQKYSSLFAGKGDAAQDDEEGPEESRSRPKPPMWAEVERRMKTGTLEELRNGSTSTEAPLNKTEGIDVRESSRAILERPMESERKPKGRARGDTNVNAAKETRREANDDADNSDGGFFE